jgi:hypothetical protein
VNERVDAVAGGAELVIDPVPPDEFELVLDRRLVAEEQ